jgi:hypothetical protein
VSRVLAALEMVLSSGLFDRIKVRTVPDSVWQNLGKGRLNSRQFE